MASLTCTGPPGGSVASRTSLPTAAPWERGSRNRTAATEDAERVTHPHAPLTTVTVTHPRPLSASQGGDGNYGKHGRHGKGNGPKVLPRRGIHAITHGSFRGHVGSAGMQTPWADASLTCTGHPGLRGIPNTLTHGSAVGTRSRRSNSPLPLSTSERRERGPFPDKANSITHAFLRGHADSMGRQRRGKEKE